MFRRKQRRSREFKNSSQIIDIEEVRDSRRRRREESIAKKSRPRKTKLVINGRMAGKISRRRNVYIVIFLIILIIISVSAFNIISLKLNEAKVEQQHEELLKKKAALQKELSQINTPEYIEQQARQQLKMIKPGETLYVLPDESKTTSTGIKPD